MLPRGTHRMRKVLLRHLPDSAVRPSGEKTPLSQIRAASPHLFVRRILYVIVLICGRMYSGEEMGRIRRLLLTVFLPSLRLRGTGRMRLRRISDVILMERRLLFVGAILILSMAAVTAVKAEKRVALVIGNSAYRYIDRLGNSANDASLIAATLRDLDFTLVGDGPQLDLDKTAIDRVVQAFGAQLQGADVGLFYFSGHGLQLHGSNYLIPTDANPTKEADVYFQTLDANLVLRQMEGAGTRLNLVILDACRNNPFGVRGVRSTGSGLAQMQAPEGTLISFATQPGNVAFDGNDGNSPFTRALAQTIRRPGLDIFRTFNEVGLEVSRKTGGEQRPWVAASPINGDFYFSRSVEATALASPVPAPSAPLATYDPVSTVRQFYLALSRADGNAAEMLVVPEKRGIGPYNGANIAQFYSSLPKPMEILGVERASSDVVKVKYRFVRPNGKECLGDATVNTVFTDGRTLIQRIAANC
jgi:hypothetical protein